MILTLFKQGHFGCMIQMAMDQYLGKKWKTLFQSGIQGLEHSFGLDREVRVRSVILCFSNIFNG